MGGGPDGGEAVIARGVKGTRDREERSLCHWWNGHGMVRRGLHETPRMSGVDENPAHILFGSKLGPRGKKKGARFVCIGALRIGFFLRTETKRAGRNESACCRCPKTSIIPLISASDFRVCLSS